MSKISSKLVGLGFAINRLMKLFSPVYWGRSGIFRIFMKFFGK